MVQAVREHTQKNTSDVDKLSVKFHLFRDVSWNTFKGDTWFTKNVIVIDDFYNVMYRDNSWAFCQMISVRTFL